MFGWLLKKAKHGHPSSSNQQPSSVPQPSSPPVSRPQLHSLPDIAHNGIGSFLTNMERNELMVVARSLMEAYGEQVIEVALKKGAYNVEFCLPMPGLHHAHRSVIYVDPEGHVQAPLLIRYVDNQGQQQHRLWIQPSHSNVWWIYPDLVRRLLSRRPGVKKLVVQDEAAAMAVAEAMTWAGTTGQERCGKKVQYLGVAAYHPDGLGFEKLYEALGRGAFPSLTAIDIGIHKDPEFGQNDYLSLSKAIPLVGSALGSRKMETDGRHQSLKNLTFTGRHETGALDFSLRSDPTPILSSGACEELEELVLKGWQLDMIPQAAIVAWLSRTGAPHLRVLIAPCQSGLTLATALSTPGIAPRLQVLDIGCVGQASVQALSDAVERGAWPCLEELSLVDNGIGKSLFGLMGALHYCSPKMRVLQVKGQGVSGNKAAAMAIVRALQLGALSNLQELSLRSTAMGCEGVVELTKALKRRPPMLRKLDVSDCGIGEGGMREFAKAMQKAGGDGAYRDLLHLNLNSNHLCYLGDSYLSDAMRSGALNQLQELCVGDAGVGQPGIAVIVEALKCNACPRLTRRAIMSQVIGPAFDPLLREKMAEVLYQSGRAGF